MFKVEHKLFSKTERSQKVSRTIWSEADALTKCNV